MSHFTVLVLSKSAEQLDDLMEPFSENIDVEPYWTEASIDWALTEEQLTLTPEAKVAAYRKKYPDSDDEKFRVNDGRIEQQSTYNPDSKWDYWRIGGRWAGGLRLKVQDGVEGYRAPLSWEWTADPQDAPPDDFVDQALKVDVDIDGMRDDAERQATERYEIYAALLAEHGEWVPWRTIMDKYANDRDKAREEYKSQPIVQAADKQLADGSWFFNLEDEFRDVSREEYIEAARLGAVPGYAFLSEEGWDEPGRMGWFGMSDDDSRSRLDYARRVNRIIDEAPDDSVLTIVDCHI